MTNTMLILLASLILALGLTPGFRHLAYRTGAVDTPGERKLHPGPVPVLGGVAIYLAVILAVAFLGDSFYIKESAGILLGATIISFAGFWDDRKALRPIAKLIVQFFASAVVVLSGVTVGLFPSDWINAIVTIVWLTGVSNAFNLVDNMDGLSAGLAAIAALFFLVFAAINGQYLVGILAAAVLGACLGFLFYNFNPATIFMGDAGSLFLGFLIAAIGIKLRFPHRPLASTWMVPIFVLAVPLFDSAFVSVSRAFRGQSILKGGRDHVSHRLSGQLKSDRKTVLALYGFGVLSGLLGVTASFSTPPIARMLLVAVTVLAIIAYFRLVHRFPLDTR